MIVAPIALFVYNRLSHTRQTVEALQKNELVDCSDLFIFADGAKSQASISNVNDVSNGGSKWTEELDLRNVLFPGSLVHLREHKRLHRVDVHQSFDQFVIRVGKYLRCQILAHSDLLGHLEDLLPHFNVLLDYCNEVFHVLVFLSEVIDLSKDDTVQDVLWHWQILLKLVEMAKDHVSSRVEFLLV